MKNHFADDYCPQREKVLDLSRSILSGNRTFAKHRRNDGRYRAKVERRRARARLDRAASWMCICAGDPDVDCNRCYADDLPTISETHGGEGLPLSGGTDYESWTGHADLVSQLFRWFEIHTIEMDHHEAETFLRAKFLVSPFGHSLKIRHAYDHLFEGLAFHRRKNYDGDWNWWALQNLQRCPDAGKPPGSAGTLTPP